MELVLATNWVKVFKQDEMYVFVSREDTNNEKAPYSLQVRFEVGAVDIKVAPEFADEDKRDATFDKADCDNVSKMVEGIKDQFFKDYSDKKD